MSFTVKHAVTGEVLLSESRYDYFRMRGWELLLKLKHATQSRSPFQWRLVAQQQEIDPSATLGQYEDEHGINIQCLKQEIVASSQEECHDLIAILVHRERQQLWEFLQKGRTIPATIWREFGTVNPLLMAINANVKDSYEWNEVSECWPDTVFSLLLAKGDPNASGNLEDTLLCQAIRSSDCRAVGQLLAFNADPNLCEKCGPPPIFWAIRMASAEYVQQLLDYRADPLAKEIVYMEDNVERLLAYNVDPTAAGTAARGDEGSGILLTRAANHIGSSGIHATYSARLTGSPTVPPIS